MRDDFDLIHNIKAPDSQRRISLPDMFNSGHVIVTKIHKDLSREVFFMGVIDAESAFGLELKKTAGPLLKCAKLDEKSRITIPASIYLDTSLEFLRDQDEALAVRIFPEKSGILIGREDDILLYEHENVEK